MRYQRWTLILICCTLLSFLSSAQSPEAKVDKIQIAFLLDVSSSMDQLILKVKSQFWRVSTYLSTATKNGRKPAVEFALIIYGLNPGGELSKVLTDFNADLDSVALNLHDIQICGGSEYCWTTIDQSLEELNWSKEKDDLKLLVIAGNESFTQEEYDSKKVIAKCKKMHVVINTIYCSNGADANDPVSVGWKQAAELAKGNYFQISLTDSLELKENFLDNKLSVFNEKLNATYVPFGPNGQKNYNRMILQDENSRMAGVAFFRERIIYKTTTAFKNPTWDLVDAFQSDSTICNDSEVLKSATLTFVTPNDFKIFISDKLYARQEYHEVIRLRYDMIKKYIGENAGDKDLDLAMRQIIDKEGKKRKFEFKKQD